MHRCKEKKASSPPEGDDRDLYGYTCYDGLWSLMKKYHITKKKLISLSGISENDYRKMKKKEDVSLFTLRKISKLFLQNVCDLISFKF